MTPVLLDLFHELRQYGAVEVPIEWQDAGLLPRGDAPAVGVDGYRAGYLLCLALSALRWNWGAAGAAEKFRETVCYAEIKRLKEWRLSRPQRGRPPKTKVAKAKRALDALLDAAQRLLDRPLSAPSRHLSFPSLLQSARRAGRPPGPTAETVVRVWCIESLRRLSKLPLATAIRLLNSRLPELAYSEVPEAGVGDTGADLNARFRVERRRVQVYLNHRFGPQSGQ
jgi:hypothetical protein